MMMKVYAPPKRRFLQEPHGVASQKTVFLIVTAVNTSIRDMPVFTNGENPFSKGTKVTSGLIPTEDFLPPVRLLKQFRWFVQSSVKCALELVSQNAVRSRLTNEHRPVSTFTYTPSVS
jgi:hypothetical protein